MDAPNISKVTQLDSVGRGVGNHVVWRGLSLGPSVWAVVFKEKLDLHAGLKPYAAAAAMESLKKQNNISIGKMALIINYATKPLFKGG